MKTKNRQKTKKKTEKGRALRLRVFGVVQGVGFRPFVFRLAHSHGLRGWVKNIGYGVEIHIESANKARLSRFTNSVEADKPPLALIEKAEARPARFSGYRDFRIKKSREGESFVFISPDISTCRSCFEEITDPGERRFRYPFTNCTDCGPRYTIVKSLPYDRAKTTMAGFSMCPACRREYENPLDRRYHAQPIACPVCGPRLTLKESRTGKTIKGGIDAATELIGKGKILAVKGLGGFHLVCDPLNEKAVQKLRRLKQRKTKPLALMARDIGIIKKYAFVSWAESRELASASRPIVLLRKKRDIPGIAPHLDEIGFMLPYTPLHHLLLQRLGLIVATSSNKKDAPIAKDEKEGIAPLCDFILTHNRPIQSRADDSVLKVVGGQPLFLRRARGFVPYPQRVPAELQSAKHILALGGELKDTISLYKNGYIITSQFLGDLDEYQNYEYFKETIDHLKRLFDIKPGLIVCDLHPNFHTTRYAQESGLPYLQVQHHYAHVLAVLLEHGVCSREKVLGVSLDGYGYGQDGQAWGGEFLLADYASCNRIAHFRTVPLPGGDQAARQPWRMALAYLRDAFGAALPRVKALEKIPADKRRFILRLAEAGLNSPSTSSCGRLFDAVSFIAGAAPADVEFEAEAPMRLEALANSPTGAAYTFSLDQESSPWQLSFAATIREIVSDLGRKAPVGEIASRFHNTLSRAIAAVAEKAREEFGITTVVLVGGVFLNKRLLATASALLAEKNFSVLRPVRYSPNDESISLGQIAYALAWLKQSAHTS
ncbi:MAG: carbamoyltransferase HypF [Clostridiales bacterium]|nr:carbamoyltransferase HypF [Clostridiales bacterium]